MYGSVFEVQKIDECQPVDRDHGQETGIRPLVRTITLYFPLRCAPSVAELYGRIRIKQPGASPGSCKNTPFLAYYLHLLIAIFHLNRLHIRSGPEKGLAGCPDSSF